MSTCILIPAYEPDEKLVSLVGELHERGFRIIVVNDGSNAGYQKIFDKCKPYAAVIGYGINRGKGYALKYGMRYIRDNCPDITGFVTADSDGQHSVKDISAMSDRLSGGEEFIISVRSLRPGRAPVLSRIGNGLSRFMFALANARYLPDNQSGLRGFSVRHIDWMLNVEGDKYDYELNILLIAEKQNIKVTKLTIETIYFDNNSGTHFKPLTDTLRIYKTYFKTNFFTLISLMSDLTVVILATIFLGYAFFPLFILFNCWVHISMCIVVERYTLFRRIRYTPGSRRLVLCIFKYFIYGLICLAGFFFHIPFIAAYIAALIIVAFGEYYLLKVTYD